MSAPRMLRRGLDGLYRAAGYLAALCLFMLLVVIVTQMIARWTVIELPGATDYAGYLMAAASFLAFADTLNRGGHIRVGLFLTALGRYRWYGEFWCWLVGTVLAGFLGWSAIRAVYWSYVLGDVSQGQDEMRIWIVQIPMAVGGVLLFIAFLDNLITHFVTGRDNIVAETVEQSRTE